MSQQLTLIRIWVNVGGLNGSSFFFSFLAALGLLCCTKDFSSCSERGLLFIPVFGLLIAVASLVVEQGIRASVVAARRFHSCDLRVLECGPSNCGTWAWLLYSMGVLLGPGIEPVSPASAGGFLSTAPPGKSRSSLF